MFKTKRLYSMGSTIQKVQNCQLIQTRGLAGKDEKPSDPKKEEQYTIKMPGFVHPDNIKEEGYFTQKAKQQLEELKRKGNLPTVESSDKKI